MLESRQVSGLSSRSADRRLGVVRGVRALRTRSHVLGVLHVLVATLLPALLSESIYVVLKIGIMLTGSIAFGIAAVTRANRLLADRRTV